MSEAGTDLDVILAQFIALDEEGRAPDVETYCREQHPQDPEELSRRIGTYRALQRRRTRALDPEPGLPAEPAAPPQHLDHFEQLELLGEGGLSWVFRAHDTELNRHVAVKVLKPNPFESRDARAWSLNEARIMAQLEHPNVVRVFDVGSAGGHDYVTMEYVRGPSLDRVLRQMAEHAGLVREEPSPPPEPGQAKPDATGTIEYEQAVSRCAHLLQPAAARAALVADIARAMDSCHSRGVIHRDIKPSNVLLEIIDDVVRPKVIDFGLAHDASAETSLTDVTHRWMGTPSYTSPEQIDQASTGASTKSDQFALGIVLYELLTLQHPFRRVGRDATTLYNIAHLDPAPPSKCGMPGTPYADELDLVCLHMLGKDPERRYRSMGELAADLDALLERRPISISPPSPIRRMRLWARRRRRELLFVAAAVLANVAWFAFDEQGQRRTFVEDVEAFAADLPSRESPDDFRDAYGRFADMLDDAEDLDDEWFGRLFYEAVRPDVDTRRDELSRNLDRAMAPDRALIDQIERGALASFEGAHRIRPNLRPILGHWSDLLRLDRELCPESTWNQRERERGDVALADPGPFEDVRLFLHRPTASEALTVLEAVNDFDDLADGTYRLHARKQGEPVTYELEFSRHAEDRKRLLAPQPPHALLDPLWIQVPATTLQVQISKQPTAITMDSFWITRRVMTWSEARELLGDAEMERFLHGTKSSGKPRGEPDKPALLPALVALQLAQSVGARLPTPAELEVAYRGGAPGFEPADVPSELTSLPFRFGNDQVRYLRRSELEMVPNAWVHGTRVAALQAEAGLRFARSHAPNATR